MLKDNKNLFNKELYRSPNLYSENSRANTKDLTQILKKSWDVKIQMAEKATQKQTIKLRLFYEDKDWSCSSFSQM